MKSLKDHILSYDNYKKVFVIIKPGSLQYTPNVIQKMEEYGWEMDKSRVKLLTLKEAKQLYLVHKEEEFYDDLCEYMSSDLSRAIIFKKSQKSDGSEFDEVAKLKDEIRNEYGESDMRNVMHSSDSREAMFNEAPIYFNII